MDGNFDFKIILSRCFQRILICKFEKSNQMLEISVPPPPHTHPINKKINGEIIKSFLFTVRPEYTCFALKTRLSSVSNGISSRFLFIQEIKLFLLKVPALLIDMS